MGAMLAKLAAANFFRCLTKTKESPPGYFPAAFPSAILVLSSGSDWRV